jgi:predicted metal-binding membrane protein
MVGGDHSEFLSVLDAVCSVGAASISVANAGMAFLIVLAMTLGLILPRMLFEQFRPAGRSRRVRGKPLSPFSH